MNYDSMIGELFTFFGNTLDTSVEAFYSKIQSFPIDQEFTNATTISR